MTPTLKPTPCRCHGYRFPHRVESGRCAWRRDPAAQRLGRHRPEPESWDNDAGWQAAQDRYEAALDARASQ